MTEAQKQRFAGALSRLSGDEKMLEMLATIATEDAPGMLDAMDKYLRHNDLPAYAKAAHALKGLLSAFEVGEPVSKIQLAIDASRQGDERVTKSLHAEINAPIEKLISEIAEITPLSA